MGLKKLTEKHILFAKLLLAGVKPTEACRQAGFSSNTAKQASQRLRRDPLIKDYLKNNGGETISEIVHAPKKELSDEYQEIVADAQTAQRFHKIEVSRNRLINELFVIGTFDPAVLFDKNGELLHVKDMPIEARHAIQSIDVKTIKDREGNVTIQQVVKMHPKLGAIDLILKNTEKQKKKILESTPEERIERINALKDKMNRYND